MDPAPIFGHCPKLSRFLKVSFKPGDVFKWDINRLNFSHVKGIVSDTGKVDSNEFCQVKEFSKKEFHLFGDFNVDPINNFEGQVLCKRLNGKIKLLPSTKEEMIKLQEYMISFQVKINETDTWLDFIWAWVGGVSKIGEGTDIPHWHPDDGIYDFVDPKTGKNLITEENKEFVVMDDHTYQQYVDVCSACELREALKIYKILDLVQTGPN